MRVPVNDPVDPVFGRERTVVKEVPSELDIKMASENGRTQGGKGARKSVDSIQPSKAAASFFEQFTPNGCSDNW